MKNINIKYFLFFLVIWPLAFSQNKISNAGIPNISSGGEYSRILQKAIRKGESSFIKVNSNPIQKTQHSSLTISPFYGPTFDDNMTYNGILPVPPDPNAAAGIDRVISVINCIIECRDKAGSLLWIDDLAGFFSSLSPATYTFDPKVIYDQYENRFVVVALEIVQTGTNPDPGNNTSWIFLAVSKTSSPTSATSSDWYYTSINALETIGGFDHWLDYPGFSLDEEAVYICGNMFAHEGGTTSFRNRLWIVDKGVATGFYSGGASSISSAIDFVAPTGGLYGTHQPAHVFGTGGVALGTGTFLIQYDGLTYGGSSGAEAVQVIRVDDPLGTPTFSIQIVDLSNLENIGSPYGWPDLPDAPQLGSGTAIEVNDRRILNAVWRNDNLYLTTTINPGSGTDAGQATAHWIQINTSTLASLTLTDEGNIGAEDIAAGTRTFFPSVAVNSTGDLIVGFSASAPTIYPGAYYAGRFSGDAAGTVKPTVVVKAGLDYYVRKKSGTRNRWGDYSGACIDPSNGSFWLFNEYAMERGTEISGEDGRWATVYVNVPVSELPVELVSFSASIVGIDIQLNWRTETESQNYGFEIERLTSGQMDLDNAQSNGIFEKIGFAAGHGNSNHPNDYTFKDEKVPAGKHSYRLKQLDSDGNFSHSDILEIEIAIPKQYELSQNYPNPFNPVTTISWQSPVGSHQTLKVYDVLGNEVATLVDEFRPAGSYEIEFNAEELSSGIYFYKVQAGSFVETKKMILLR